MIAELMEENVKAKNRVWGTLSGQWVLHDTRDEIVDYVRYWSQKTELAAGRIVRWIGIGNSKFYDWKKRYG